jgi:hypothetical protein
MKLVKLGLSAVVLATLASSAFSADTLSEALKNGKFNGELKAIGYDVDKAAKGKESIVSLGVMLNYVTAPFYGFSAGFRAQGSSSPWANSAEKKFYKNDLYGPGAVLEEAYLKYQIKKTSLKAGRQFIKTPLLAGNGSRIIHESFEGYTANIKDIPKTRLFVGYINKYLTRTDFLEGNAKTRVGNFDKNIFMYGKTYAYKMGDGIWTAMLVNQSVKGLKLTGQYLLVKDATVAKTGASMGDISVALAQAEYKFKLSGLGMLAGIQYGTSDVDKDNSRSGSLIGFKVATKYKKLNASLGYVVDSNDKGMVSGVGISSNWAYAGDIIGLESYNKDTDALSLNLKYHFAKNIMVLGRYTDYIAGSTSTLNGGDDLNAYDLVAMYKFKGSFKGLSTKFHYENVDFNTGAVKNYRFYVNYKF